MSSICGIWTLAGAEEDSRALHSRMLHALQVYGPDRQFSWGEPRIALGGNLMSLLPEDRWDDQPLWNDARTACLVADVRLDNRSDLVRELGIPAADVRADSDILLAAWDRWGAGCLDHILGAFAFAVWTPARQELFAARDHDGERPLFYHSSGQIFAFASMPKGLMALPRLSCGVDEEYTARSMVMEVDRTKSFFTGISVLPMGHWLRATPAGVESRRYWHPYDARPIRFKTDQEYAEGLLEVFDRATAARLRTTGSIGSELSSGLDSSSVTAAAAGLLARQGKGLTAFTSVPRAGIQLVGPSTRILDEGPAAAEVAAMYPNIEHLRVDTAGADLLEALRATTQVMDDPVRSGVNQLWISHILRQARERGIKVMLQGAMGNATISHNGRGALTPIFQGGHWIRFLKTSYRLRRNGYLSVRQAAALATDGWQPRWLAERLTPDVRDFSLDYSPVRPELAERYGLRERMLQEFHGHRDERAERSLFFEQYDFGPQNTAAQALFGIDQRDPTQDKRVFEYCYSIPPEQYLAEGMTRSLVRRAMRGRLPPSTLSRTLRGLQAADWYLSVREALPSFREELERIAQSPTARRMLDLERLRTLAQGMPDGGYERPDVINGWNYALPRGISYGYFLRKHDGL